MRPRPNASPEPETPVSVIAAVYLAEANGDAVLALHRAVADALTDLCEAERRSFRRDRLISRGYVRAALDGTS